MKTDGDLFEMKMSIIYKARSFNFESKDIIL